MSEHNVMTIEEARFEPAGDLAALERRALGVGVVAAVGVGIGLAVLEAKTFWAAYLNGWLLVVAVSMGLFGLGMLNHVSGGRWGVLARAVFEASGRTLPLVFVMGLPLAIRPEILYSWARAGALEGDPLLQHKEPWLNSGRFLACYVGYFAAWWLLSFFMSRWSRRYDETGDERFKVWMQKLSAGGLVVYVLSATFASVDWIMSLDPHWFSSLFGFGFVIGHGLAAFAFLVPMMLFLGSRRPLDRLVSARLYHDYGKLMLAFVMLWTYMMISQYLIIWSGNLPEEIVWYIDRNTHGWKLISVLLVALHFAVPFFLLLSQDLKKRPRLLAGVAVWILVMRWFDYYWQTVPSIHHEGVSFTWVDPLVPLALGGLWLAFLVRQLKGRPMVPVREPLLQEVLAHG